jgi:DnaJ family protein C protein 19
MIELTVVLQGRAGLVAYRRSQGGVNAAGKAFYKGLVKSCRQNL